MRKIPTVFRRDIDTGRVRDVVLPGCEWVTRGAGVATVKWDGVCVMYDGVEWWARRTVTPDKDPPPRFEAVDVDDKSGTAVGWEPAGRSPFASLLAEAADRYPRGPSGIGLGTYELCGPRINGNPHNHAVHYLLRHGCQCSSPGSRTYETLRDWMEALDYEGVVWWHPDGRRAKLKRRDFGFPWPRMMGGRL